MTRITSSPSAKDTPKTAEKPDTSGTPPTDPNSANTSDGWDGLIDLLGDAFPGKEIKDLTGGSLPLSFRATLAFARVKHAFGLHTWVVSEVYDPTIRRLIYDGYSCVMCDETRWG